MKWWAPLQDVDMFWFMYKIKLCKYADQLVYRDILIWEICDSYLKKTTGEDKPP